jgi:thiol-disulfide isomerase/thioredoxin
MLRGLREWGVAFAAMAALLALCGCNAGPREPAPQNTPPAAVPEAKPGEIGSRLPRFAVKDIAGREFSSADLHGKVVLINFWATWCAPCVKEMPGFQQLQDRYRKQGLVVVGIALDADSSAVASFASELGVRYPLLLNTPQLQQDLGGILGLPTTLVFDRQGTLRKKTIGFDYKEEYESSIEGLL